VSHLIVYINPDHQFGFQPHHSTIDQVHGISNIIEQSLEEKKVCSTIFWTLLRSSIKSGMKS